MSHTSALEGTSSRGQLILGINAALIAITSIIVLARLYVRRFMLKALGLDDIITTIAFSLCVVGSAIDIAQVDHGSGMPMQYVSEEDLNIFFMLLAVAKLVYFLSSGFVRLSILAFLPRLCRETFFMRWIWTLVAIIVSTSIAGFFFTLAECKPISDNFNHRKPNRNCVDKDIATYVMCTHAVLGVCIDIILFGLPIWVIRRNMKFSTKAIQVILVFSVGLFAIITGILRLAFVATIDFTINTTYNTLRVGAWTMTEVHVGLWCACFPALQPLLRLVSYKMGLRSALDSTAKGTKNKNGVLDQTCSDRLGANGYFKQDSRIDREGDNGSQTAIISGGVLTTEDILLDDIHGRSK
ncbi:hypothetical protein Forpi1262_v015684 [Fusarium oxysporum f. sp. raphani]|uniref:Rhodopsin domain-containing protein n=1 Tax=Fusarium oxysporum f. sp. raphani TaxID=96318 RepID=A0A8J5PQX0_FUSOX|nr:hypothetical protein Forpi1262_v015684 [Fusarium oxysporum f. sp. raphani]